ncbi:Endonuclease/exonuclease/phosphatase superfamily [Arabidopsis thaliana x Arabidopsis arenosa]|uniref:Endonuclease/exonuclease/phosphatase superfamily n=1 Tax=Arabidopsis thaliana x Arabidopsis arenosa TaxID=1240361 RepID=A0A8T2CGJ9_9BRAS|nr:Endonuclease/exonuclease/phosphatase superfamily [Arabidopsis thaliana x Arabidopsis arenosa]
MIINGRAQLSFREKGKGIQVEEDGSRTITASEIRQHRLSGSVFYREKAPKSPSTTKSPDQAVGTKEAAISPSDPISLAIPKVITPEEEDMQLQKEIDEMKARHSALSADERKTLQEKADKLYADELHALHMRQVDVDNDDLLDDDMQNTDNQLSGEHTVSEQLIPISNRQEKSTSPSLSPGNKQVSPSPSRRPVKERIEIPKGSMSKSAHRRRRAETKRRISQSPIELPGVASKKRNILLNGSPKKRSVNKSQTLRSRTGKPAPSLPRTGVFPSSVNKRTKSHSGLVGSQNPPSFLFLSETKNERSVLEERQLDLGYDNLFTVEPEGNSGGLALLYSNDYPTTVLSFTNRLIDVETIIDGNKVFLSFVYGDPVVKYRENVWERLTRIGIERSGPWFLIGDFNELCGNHEKQGGKKRSENSFLPFNTMIHNCGLVDFPYKGNPFSWVGRRRNGLIKCMLDKAFGTEDWHNTFSHTNVEYLRLWGSDHRPLLAHIHSKNKKRKRSFQFDKRWLGKEGLEEAVIAGWGAPSEDACDIRNLMKLKLTRIGTLPKSPS